MALGLAVLSWAAAIMAVAIFIVPEHGGGPIVSAAAVAGGFVAPAGLLAIVLRDPVWQQRLESGGRRRERELFRALRAQGTLTAETLALRSSLTRDEAKALLERLAASGHLECQESDGAAVYRTRSS